MKKKKVTQAVGLTLAAAISLSGLSAFAGCKKDNRKYYNNDTDALVFSTLEVDGVFNPFYSTSATDSNIVGMTQIGMISNDEAGNPVVGDNEATVVKDMEITDNGLEQDKGLQTTYKFVLKNDLKFSNGSPLTMKDVFFNLYEYLDPAYTGSSTIYSTDIVGLKAYRTQTANENEQKEFETKYQTLAENRISTLVTAADYVLDIHGDDIDDSEDMRDALRAYAEEMKDGAADGAYDYLVSDYDKAVELFIEELGSDWSNSIDSYEDTIFTDSEGNNYKNLFTTDVEVFLYNENYIQWNKKDAELNFTFVNSIDEIKAHANDPDKGKQWAINQILIDKIPDDISEIVQYWMTAVTLADFIAKDAMEKDFAGKELQFSEIEGIKFANRTQSVTVNGVTYGIPTYNSDGSVKEGYEVLFITINNIDPKAIWNFSFAVAPMYYYSSEYEINRFSFEEHHFGVTYNSQSFQNDAIKNVNKIGVPVGAGPYVAAKDSGGTDNVTSGDFKSHSVIYFESNPYYVLGQPLIKKVRYQVVSSSQMTNSLYANEVHFCEPSAKPETVTELNNKQSEGIASKSVRTAGYGYIGVNASKVPSLYVRQAIMHSIDTSLVVKYYGTTASAIHRSMSLANWAYPDGATAYYPYIGGKIPENLDVVNPNYRAFVLSKGLRAGDVMTAAQQSEFIKYLVEDLADYVMDASGIYMNRAKTIALKYDFTIAGAETDHPAWNAMYQAGTFLNKNGFQINVRTDANALKKLSTGDLAVWAAAWGSTIDPDMYQVYHKDSTASSTKNWGYDAIKNGMGGDRSAEQAILDELAEYIELARTTNDREQRSEWYKIALDLVMQLAVELPTYQRDDLFAYNSNYIDSDSLNANPSPYKGLTSDIHKVSLVVAK